MRSTPFTYRIFFIFGIPLALLASLCVLLKSSGLILTPTLNLAITLDLVLTIPLVYFFLIVKTKIPKITVLPIVLLGCFLGSILLPKDDQPYLDLFKLWALPIIEIGVLVLISTKVYNFIKTFRQKNSTKVDFFDVVKEVSAGVFPHKIASIVATEIAVFYYVFLFWKKRNLEKNEFSYHKNNGTLSLLGAIIFILSIETAVLHLVLAKWSETLAWVLTFLSIYTVIQLFGFLKSLWDRPHKIEGAKLYLRYGIMKETCVDLNQLVSVEVSSKDIEIEKGVMRLSFLGSLEGHNVIIRLKEDTVLTGLYGIRKPYRTLLFFVDNPVEFQNKIDAYGL